MNVTVTRRCFRRALFPSHAKRGYCNGKHPFARCFLGLGICIVLLIKAKKLHSILLKVLLLPFSDQLIPFGDYMEVWLLYSDMMYTKYTSY